MTTFSSRLSFIANLAVLSFAVPAAAWSVVAAHPADGPKVVAVSAVARDILAIVICANTIEHPGLVPYTAAPGDEAVEKDKDKPQWMWDESRKAFAQLCEKDIYRVVAGQRTRLGTLSPDGTRVLPADNVIGKPLETRLVDDPSAYAITSTDDPAYAKPLPPKAVNRKSKPTDSGVDGCQPVEHHIYLRLPTPLIDGRSYTIALQGLNTAVESVAYRHDTANARSEAVHAIHTGYRPNDPSKRASLSIWLGTGGGYQHEGLEAFELRDDKGKVVFTGKPVLVKAKDATETLIAAKDYAKTAVWGLDFSTFDKPGRYRVHVPGIGCSDTFEIAADVWTRAFITSMRGFVNQRNGIALEAPWADLKRPRPFHPDDGVHFFQLTIPERAGQEGARGDDLVKLSKAGALREAPGVWGGYQDAGDWDSLSGHLAATELLLELAEMFPTFAASTRLSLPPAEAGNKIPDVLDEALWNLALFRRLQLPDGSVRGGYGEGWGARPAATSSQGKAVGVYAPDLGTTILYAGCAAKASRVLAKIDAALASDFRASSLEAWAWAEAHPDAAATDASPAASRWHAFAAIELYALTSEARFRDAFIKVTELAKPGRFVEQPEATFTYACLPAASTDAELRKKAVALFASVADNAIAFAAGNAFGVITDRTDLPMISWVGYFSTPGMASQNLPRAHFLTKDPRHLAAVVQACTYGLGANPENRTYTVGVGHDWPRHPLHVDSRASGQPAPVGITIYGCADEAGDMSRGSNDWVHKWFTYGMVPDSYSWPAQESDLDIFVAPSLDEFTISQQLGPVSFFWGYLAARP